MLPPSKIQPSAAVLQADIAKKKAESTAELLNKFVMVPPTAATDEEISRCPICKETFKNEYSEEEEDWVWRNCIEIDGKVSLVPWSRRGRPQRRWSSTLDRQYLNFLADLASPVLSRKL